jgi:hypothetical protein
MHIAINVNDATVANKILTYLKKFKKEEVVFETLEDASLKTYLESERFQKDRESLHQTLADVTSGKSKLLTIDAHFWNEMDNVIESAWRDSSSK